MAADACIFAVWSFPWVLMPDSYVLTLDKCVLVVQARHTFNSRSGSPIARMGLNATMPNALVLRC